MILRSSSVDVGIGVVWNIVGGFMLLRMMILMRFADNLHVLLVVVALAMVSLACSLFEHLDLSLASCSSTAGISGRNKKMNILNIPDRSVATKKGSCRDDDKAIGMLMKYLTRMRRMRRFCAAVAAATGR